MYGFNINEINFMEKSGFSLPLLYFFLPYVFNFKIVKTILTKKNF